MRATLAIVLVMAVAAASAQAVPMAARKLLQASVNGSVPVVHAQSLLKNMLNKEAPVRQQRPGGVRTRALRWG